MKKRKKFKLKSHGNIIVAKVNKVQADVLNSDEYCFKIHPNLISYVRKYIEGEFPDSFLTEDQIKEVAWVRVKIENGLITRYPLRQTDFELICKDPMPELNDPTMFQFYTLEVKK